MILAVDVFYNTDNVAKIVGVLFENWADNALKETIIEYSDNIEPYESGSFYKRELPCILKVLSKISYKVDFIVIDGYVYLNDDYKKGLGAYLYEALSIKIPIIGVAKNSFHNNTKNVKEILRGKSKHPLFVTSIGISIELASKNIESMFGEYRIPKLLKDLDQETKVQ